MSFGPGKRILIGLTRSDSGTDFQWKRDDDAWQSLLRLNEFLNRVYVAPFVDLHYQASDGRDTTARIFLPPTYHKGEPLPVITNVYISQVASNQLHNYLPQFDNMALALAYGYAVRYPTINPTEYALSFAPYNSLPRDVVPAVNAAVPSGIADPRRLYLFGHSYAPSSTYSLI